MAIDLVTEQTFPLADAAKFLPHGRKGKPIHFITVLRWVVDGALSLTGKRIHLEAVRLGNRWLTSREALERFAELLTPRINGKEQPAGKTAGRHKRAAAKLEKMGTKRNGSAGGRKGQHCKNGSGEQ